MHPQGPQAEWRHSPQCPPSSRQRNQGQSPSPLEKGEDNVSQGPVKGATAYFLQLCSLYQPLPSCPSGFPGAGAPGQVPLDYWFSGDLVSPNRPTHLLPPPSEKTLLGLIKELPGTASSSWAAPEREGTGLGAGAVRRICGSSGMWSGLLVKPGLTSPHVQRRPQMQMETWSELPRPGRIGINTQRGSPRKVAFGGKPAAWRH